MTDIQLSRRGFLIGMAAVGAVASLPFDAVAGIPVIVGDGVHDDTAALQALLDGKDVIKDGFLLTRPAGGGVILRDGVFRTTDALRITRNDTLVERCKFLIEGRKGIQVEGVVENLQLTDCIFDGSRMGRAIEVKWPRVRIKGGSNG